jgi:transposase
VSSAEVLEAAAGRLPDAWSPSLKPFDRELVNRTKREHIELVMQARQWKSLHERAVRRLELTEKRHQFEFGQAQQREARLKAELDSAQAQIRDLRQRVFGAKSEQSSSIDAVAHSTADVRRPRGQQRGRPGHGRTRLARLPAKRQEVTSQACCQRRGLGLMEFAGTQAAEVLETEVKACRRIVQRHRYRPPHADAAACRAS